MGDDEKEARFDAAVAEVLTRAERENPGYEVTNHDIPFDGDDEGFGIRVWLEGTGARRRPAPDRPRRRRHRAR
jgi:hypothetical protein